MGVFLIFVFQLTYCVFLLFVIIFLISKGIFCVSLLRGIHFLFPKHSICIYITVGITDGAFVPYINYFVQLLYFLLPLPISFFSLVSFGLSSSAGQRRPQMPGAPIQS